MVPVSSSRPAILGATILVGVFTMTLAHGTDRLESARLVHVTPSPQELLRVLTRLGKRCRKTETRSLGECACYSSCSTLKITARPNTKNSATDARPIQTIDRRVAR